MKKFIPSSAHQEFNNAVKDLLDKFKHKLNAMEMLAVTAHLTGILIALQDQRTMTPEMAMELIQKNIEAGNAEALAMLEHSEGKA